MVFRESSLPFGIQAGVCDVELGILLPTLCGALFERILRDSDK